MVHSSGVQWTCDRCRRTVTLVHDDLPEGWQTISATDITDDKASRTWEICGACYSQMERLLMNIEAPE